LLTSCHHELCLTVSITYILCSLPYVHLAAQIENKCEQFPVGLVVVSANAHEAVLSHRHTGHAISCFLMGLWRLIKVDRGKAHEAFLSYRHVRHFSTAIFTVVGSCKSVLKADRGKAHEAFLSNRHVGHLSTPNSMAVAGGSKVLNACRAKTNEAFISHRHAFQHRHVSVLDE